MNPQFHDNAITCEARALFRNLIETLVEFDRVGSPAAGDIPVDLFAIRSAFEMQSYMRNSFSMLTVFERFRNCELEFPASHRHKLSSRLDLSRAKTYSEAAQIALEAMMLAGLALVFSALEARSITWRQISAGRAWASN
jgi:hypothetical protein